MHGLSIPLGKLGFYLPRTISRAKSSDADEPAPFHVRETVANEERRLEAGLRRGIHSEAERSDTGQGDVTGVPIPRKLSRIGGTIIKDTKAGGRGKEEERDTEFLYGQGKDKAAEEDLGENDYDIAPNETSTSIAKEENPPGAIRRRGDLTSPTSPTSAEASTRDIRFGDEMLD